MRNSLYVSATRNPVNGSWIVTGEINLYFVTRVYYGYTKREAIRLFRGEFRGV
jgi:hypothetical protein